MGLYNRGKVKLKNVSLILAVAISSIVMGAISLPFFYISDKLKNRKK